jgi:exodeoxyribonuclease VII large subunit
MARVPARLDGEQRHLRGAVTALARAPGRLDAEQRHVAGLESQVRLVDPANTLARGWSITRDSDGRAVTSAAQLTPGDVLVTTFASGVAESRVDRTSLSPSSAPSPTGADGERER